MDKKFPHRLLPLTALGVALGFSEALPAFLAAIALLVTITYWLQPFSGSRKVSTEEIINHAAQWLGGWRVVSAFFGAATFCTMLFFNAPAHALLNNARAAATSSLDKQLGAGAVDFFFGGLLLIFFFVIAGALLAGGVQVARSENPGVFFLVALVFAMILGALEFFDKIIFTAGAGGT
jgi:ABC-type multidrug transport system fused ATPase/permease subunit